MVFVGCLLVALIVLVRVLLVAVYVIMLDGYLLWLCVLISAVDLGLLICGFCFCR